MSSHSQSCVAEFVPNQHSGLWVYKCVRPDKTDGNYSEVVLDTLCGVAEKLTIEDLEMYLSV